MSALATLEDWVLAADGAAIEIATSALASSQVEHAAPEQEHEALFGAYVPLVAEGCRVQIGIVAEWEACKAVASALLGMEPESESDVFDALGEIANMTAGLVKTRMNERVPGLNTGLPLCVSGQVQRSAGVEQGGSTLFIDQTRVNVRVLLSSHLPSSRDSADRRRG